MSIRSLGLTPVLLLLAQLAVVSAQPVAAPEPLRYTLSFPAPHTHYVDVEVTRLPGIGTKQEFTTERGRLVGVLTLRDGHRELHAG